MELINKKIDVIAFTGCKGEIKPMRFRIHADYGQNVVIAIDKVISSGSLGNYKNPVLDFTCESIIDGVKRLYELRFIVNEVVWYLYRM